MDGREQLVWAGAADSWGGELVPQVLTVGHSAQSQGRTSKALVSATRFAPETRGAGRAIDEHPDGLWGLGGTLASLGGPSFLSL